MNKEMEINNFKDWIREQSEAIVLAKMEGYSEEEAMELLKLYQIERMADAMDRVAISVDNVDDNMQELADASCKIAQCTGDYSLWKTPLYCRNRCMLQLNKRPSNSRN